MTTHGLLLTLHLLGGILLLGNLLVGTFWFLTAARSGDAGRRGDGLRTLSRGDLLFNLPGFALLLVSGILLAKGFAGVFEVDWVQRGFEMFFVALLLWAAAMLPMQRRLSRHVESAPAFDRLLGRWRWVHLATLLLLLGSLGLMTLQP